MLSFAPVEEKHLTSVCEKSMNSSNGSTLKTTITTLNYNLRFFDKFVITYVMYQKW